MLKLGDLIYFSADVTGIKCNLGRSFGSMA